jgi:multidrug efflux pump subunit AcrA (membrane-fusion protein)
MSSQRPSENSVLFSLRELRRIEDDRVKKEQDAAKAKADAERQAREDSERRAREAEEQRARDEQERARLAREAEDQRQRDDQMRLQEAERRARVDGEMRINEERMRLEIQHRKKHSPVKAVLGVTGVVVLIAGGVGFKMYSDHQKELAIAREEKARVEIEAKKKQAELEARYASIEKDFAERLKKAKSQAEIEALQKERLQQRLEAQSGRPSRPHAAPKTEPDKPVLNKPKGKRDISDNPLDGLGQL